MSKSITEYPMLPTKESGLFYDQRNSKYVFGEYRPDGQFVLKSPGASGHTRQETINGKPVTIATSPGVVATKAGYITTDPSTHRVIVKSPTAAGDTNPFVYKDPVTGRMVNMSPAVAIQKGIDVNRPLNMQSVVSSPEQSESPTVVAAPIPVRSNYIGLVDWMNQHNMDSSKAAHRELAAQLGVEGYDFSAAKNQQLLELLKRLDEQQQPGSPSDLFAQTSYATFRPAEVTVTPSEPVITLPSISEMLAATEPSEDEAAEEVAAEASQKPKLSRKERVAARKQARAEYRKKLKEISAARKGGKINYFKFY